MNLCVSSNTESVWYELEEKAHDYFVFAFSTQIAFAIICEFIIAGFFSDVQIKYIMLMMFILVISTFTSFVARIDEAIDTFANGSYREIITEKYGVVHKKKMIFHFIAFLLAFSIEIPAFLFEFLFVLFIYF